MLLLARIKEIYMLAGKFKANVKYAANHPEEFQDIIQITPTDLKEMLLDSIIFYRQSSLFER